MEKAVKEDKRDSVCSPFHSHPSARSIERRKVGGEWVITMIDEQILKKHPEKEKYQILEYQEKAFALKSEIELLLIRKRNLNYDKARAQEIARNAFEKFNIPFRQQFLSEIGDIWKKVEAAESFNVVSKTDSNYLLPAYRTKTNILDCLLCLKILAFEMDYYRKTYDPLARQLSRFKEMEKGLSFDFQQKPLTIFGDVELATFSLLFGGKEREKPDWEPRILSEETINTQLRMILDLQKPKEIHVS